MDRLYLIVEIAGQRVALPAENVQSVVELESVTPVPLVAPHVAGLAALRSRVLTIIDSRASIEMEAADLAGALQAVIVMIEGHMYGLLVDQVDDVVARSGAVLPVRVALGQGWARVARGMIDLAGETLLLLDPAALVSGPYALAA